MQPASITLIESLSTAQLLEHLGPDAPASAWARTLEERGGLRGLMRLDEKTLRATMGEGNLLRFRAAFELVRRARAELGATPRPLRTPADIHAYVADDFAQARCERFLVIAMDARGQPLKKFIVDDGAVDQCQVDPRQVFGPLVELQASQFVLVHNHPTGDTEPSPADVTLTRQFREGGRFLCLRLVDHLIVSGDSYTSMVHRGLLHGQ